MQALEIGLCWGTVHRATLSETIELAARHGFPTLALHPFQFAESLDAGIDETMLRRQLADAGVRVRVIDCIIAGLPGISDAPIDIYGRILPRADDATCFRMAEALEAPIVSIVHYCNGEPTSRAELEDAIGGICRRAASRGLDIVLEFAPKTGLPDIATGHAIAKGCGEANCSLLLDSWQFARSGGTAADIANLPPRSIGAMQLSDRRRRVEGAPHAPMTGRLLPGEGDLPLEEIVIACRANNPDISVEIEVFSDELTALPIDTAAARAAAAVRAWRSGLSGV